MMDFSFLLSQLSAFLDSAAPGKPKQVGAPRERRPTGGGAGKAENRNWEGGNEARGGDGDCRMSRRDPTALPTHRPLWPLTRSRERAGCRQEFAGRFD